MGTHTAPPTEPGGSSPLPPSGPWPWVLLAVAPGDLSGLLASNFLGKREEGETLVPLAGACTTLWPVSSHRQVRHWRGQAHLWGAMQNPGLRRYPCPHGPRWAELPGCLPHPLPIQPALSFLVILTQCHIMVSSANIS